MSFGFFVLLLICLGRVSVQQNKRDRLSLNFRKSLLHQEKNEIFQKLEHQCQKVFPSKTKARPTWNAHGKGCQVNSPKSEKVKRVKEIFESPFNLAVDYFIVYRLSLRGANPDNYKHKDQISPLSLMSFQRSLRALCSWQKPYTDVLIVLNSISFSQGKEISHWIQTHFSGLGLRSVTIDTKSPQGNFPSWKYAMNWIYQSLSNPETVVLQLEDDYILQESMLQEVLEAFTFNNFCFVHPSDYPDRYYQTAFLTEKPDRIRLGLRRHWRSVESTTVTYAARLQTLRYFNNSLPNPRDDYINSLRLWKLGAEIWSPLPSLSAHMQGCNFASPYFDWRGFVSVLFDEAQEKELPFLPSHLSQVLGCFVS